MKNKLPRQPAPEQSPEERKHSFTEVSTGYTPTMAMLEASRCIQCKKPKCVMGCPVHVVIPEFIRLVAEGDFIAAAQKIRETNALPAVTGRVCPQEDQCEKYCVLGLKGEPVAIGLLERFAADYERSQGKMEIPPPSPATGKKIAIIGAGPAGLTAAGDLAQLGHEVVIFEALHMAGGVLFYGIPEFRLPKKIVEAELDHLQRQGVTIKVNYVIGKIKAIDELMGQEGFDAVFVATGSGLPYFLGIPGENLNGVYSANEFLTRVNLMHAWEFPEFDTPLHAHKNIAVIGGGNTALDSARTALRLPSAKQVTVIYRRSADEMPARTEEIRHAREEGIAFRFLESPTRILGRDGWMTGIACQKMQLGEMDASGRRSAQSVAGDEIEFVADAVVIALGSGSNPLIAQNTRDLQTDSQGHIELSDADIQMTSKEGVFAGGDIVTGAATVISAMGAWKRAALGIHDYVMSKK